MTERPERRELHFRCIEEVVVEAERLAAGNVRTTGNHSFGQILEHLALSHDMATGKIEAPRPPFVFRLLMPLMRGMILRGPVKPGFQLPKKSEDFFWPSGEVEVQKALAHLRMSIDNYNTNGPLAVHPVFGRVTREQNERLNCGHCAMHLSFVHPV